MECGDLNVPVPSLDAWGGCLLHGLPVNINGSRSQDSSAGRRQLREQVGVLELSEYWDIPCVFPSSSSGNSKKKMQIKGEEEKALHEQQREHCCFKWIFSSRLLLAASNVPYY